MTQTIKRFNEMQAGLTVIGRQRLSFFFLGAILLSLAVYISMLNLAIAEEYRKERTLKETRLISQDMQSREEFLMARLQEFYEAHAASFVSIKNEPHFVSRAANVAQVSRSLKGPNAQ